MITDMNMSDIFYMMGLRDARDLRAEAKDLDGTAIISREVAIPDFDPKKDYSKWPVNSPVADESQVWLLLQPYNAANHQGRPSGLRALWGLAHTKDPERAKPWVDAFGTSGMYMKGECYKDADGNVWRCKNDNTVHTAAALPSGWEKVA